MIITFISFLFQKFSVTLLNSNHGILAFNLLSYTLYKVCSHSLLIELKTKVVIIVEHMAVSVIYECNESFKVLHICKMIVLVNKTLEKIFSSVNLIIKQFIFIQYAIFSFIVFSSSTLIL